ncbi:MAG: hypothetical protein INQ03_04680 [Candidatus Heimdallarchaeota archaeon]|nr:hypothetical protein [Candidatus Heimdallarchaeota archaeon]
MVELEYLILLNNSGIPIFSYKLNPDYFISDDILFSAFVASLNSMNNLRPTQLVLDEREIEVTYHPELGLSTILLSDSALVFYNIEEIEVMVGLGVGQGALNSFTSMIQISQLMGETKKYMLGFTNVNWWQLDDETNDEFENDYLPFVIHKYVDHNPDCFLGDKCQYSNK